MENRPCPKCKSSTPHRVLSVQLFEKGKKTRREQLFAACVSCLMVGRDPLNHIRADVYTRVSSTVPAEPLPRAIIIGMDARTPETLGEVASRVWRSGLRVTEYDLRQALGVLRANGVVSMTTVDRTEWVLGEIQRIRAKAERRRGGRCSRCGRRAVSLYAALRTTERQSMEKVGWYCMGCGEVLLQADKLTDTIG